MKAFKKIISILIVSVLILISVIPAFAVNTDELTVLYIDKGSIVIGDGTVSGYGYFGEKITAYNSSGYCIAFSSPSVTKTTNTVVINGGENHVVLYNIKISMSSQFDCAFLLQNGAKLNLEFTGTNTITSGRARAGIEVSPNCELTLGGDGVLRAGSAGQAGIGGGNGKSNGTIIINSGTIVAQSNEESAGIGGGSSGSGGNIIINGGNISAKGGSSAAGIGGGCASDGGNITINGGTITATGGENGAGIGGGWYGEMGNVVINGGSVKATGGAGAPSIGSGNGISTEGGAVNSDGQLVYPVKISASSVGDSDKVFINGTETSVSGKHTDDSYFYFYLPVGTSFVSIDKPESTASISKVNVSSSGAASSSAVNPLQAKNGAVIGYDNIIRGISCGLTNLNDYLTVSDGYALSYDNDIIGTGTVVSVMYGDVTVFKYRTLLYGDLNNDGFYDGEDSVICLLIVFGMLNVNNADSIIIEAADADRNGNVNENDALLLENAGLKLSEVYQGSETISSDSFEEYAAIVDQTPSALSSIVVSEDVDLTETNISFLDNLIDFVKYIIKIFISVGSILKNYFI